MNKDKIIGMYEDTLKFVERSVYDQSPNYIKHVVKRTLEEAEELQKENLTSSH